jgi:hypothetical protein
MDAIDALLILSGYLIYDLLGPVRAAMRIHEDLVAPLERRRKAES